MRTTWRAGKQTTSWRGELWSFLRSWRGAVAATHCAWATFEGSFSLSGDQGFPPVAVPSRASSHPKRWRSRACSDSGTRLPYPIVQNWRDGARFGRSRNKSGATFVRHWTITRQIRSTSPRPFALARSIGHRSGRLWAKWPETGQTRPNSEQLCPTSAEYNQIRAGVDQNRPDFGQQKPGSGHFGPNLGRFRPALACHRPSLAADRPLLAAHCRPPTIAACC